MRLIGDGKSDARLITAVAAAALIAVGIYAAVSTGSTGNDGSESERPAVLLPQQVAAVPVVARSEGALRLSAPIEGAIIPSENISHALALPERAILRNVTSYSRELGIQCGEVSLDGSGTEFKRFLYIREMKTGRVDDGTQDFRTHAANVCVSRS